MATTLLQKPSSKPDFTFRCQFLGAKDMEGTFIGAEVIRMEAILIGALKELKAQEGGSIFSRYLLRHCKLCITKTACVWIEPSEIQVGVHTNPRWQILSIIQDPDDETVFGYLCCPLNREIYPYELNAFKSEEAELIIKTLSGCVRAATNILTGAAGSLYGAEDLSQNVTHLQEQLQEKERGEAKLLRKVQQLQNEFSSLQRKQEEQRQEVDEMRRQRASAEREKSSYDWIISRNEVQVTDKSLGSGGWGMVYEGRYCGCAVAVKQIREDFAPACSLKMFQREIDMASKCRHPCLLQFIGATIDGEFPLLVTELMETSLRRLLRKRPLSIEEVSIISLDVARALNYLHQKRPVPMIHRDISSANVLLWRQAGRETGIQEAQWRGKVSDYGTAKFVEEVMTQNPGCFVYSAPEGRTTTQTTKIDVYSFGVLLCEMCIQEYPEPDRRDEQVDEMSNQVLKELVRQCLQTNLDDRPDMTEVIGKLEQLSEVLRESCHIFNEGNVVTFHPELSPNKA